MKLQGKVAVVTGAGSGIGRAIALRFAAEGAKVVVGDINGETAASAVEEIKAAGGQAVAAVGNIAKEQDVQAMIDTALKEYGTLDILVNNAGIMDNFEPAGEVTDELWERIFSVNVTGTMRVTRKALSIFLEKKQGCIINVASVAGLEGCRAGAAYTASKHAMIGFSKNTAFMYALSGIRCNVIAPGGVETNILASMGKASEFGMGRMQLGMPLNPRMGQPHELAGIAVFLASDDASYVNGAVVVVDGGFTAY
ncbi:MAG TPA: SDR family oxidoreductase [Firmicutes bacterium]|jgi:NAD(P)-dependent dehydrogenase (short-subunit alcohol dehydrogenase family)|nr:SDR family oxidoreductase [Bacillota bacterium]